MYDLSAPRHKPFDACSFWGCRHAGEEYRHGLKYCLKHYKRIVEDEWIIEYRRAHKRAAVDTSEV